MEKKKVIFGSAAFLFAICSAFASSIFAPVNSFVSVLPTGQTQFVCRNAGTLCNQAAGQVCTIQVVTSTGTKTVNAHTNSSCTTNIITDQTVIPTYNPGDLQDARN